MIYDYRANKPWAIVSKIGNDVVYWGGGDAWMNKVNAMRYQNPALAERVANRVGGTVIEIRD